MKILVVDDHALIRTALRGVLGQLDSGLTMLEANDCRSAFDLIEAQPDLEQAGFEAITTRSIDVTLSYADFDDFWNAQTPSYSPHHEDDCRTVGRRARTIDGHSSSRSAGSPGRYD